MSDDYYDILSMYECIYCFDDVYLVTAFVPSDTACFASSPGNSSLTAVCTSLDDSVDFLLYRARRPASLASRSNMSVMKLFMMLIARLLIPVSGCTCFNTR